MLVIRLARTGKKKQAYFRVVVQEKQKSPTSKFIEILGNYNPHTKKLTIDSEKTIEYMSKGAQPSNSLAKLLKKEGVKLPKWVKIAERNRAPKKVEEVKAPEAETKPEDDAEAPTPESKDVKKESKPEEEKLTEEKKIEEKKNETEEKNPSTPKATKDKEDKE